MGLEGKISDDANKSPAEVKDRAEAETAVENAKSKGLDNKIKEDNRGQRKTYAALIFVIMTIWLFFVLTIFVLIGCGKLCYTDSVIIAFLTTTTINVIGIFLIVANYLFAKN